MRTIGIIITVVVLGIIGISWINLAANEREYEEAPWTTILTGGANLTDFAYTFTPPWTAFEVIVLVFGVLGVAMIKFGGSKDTPKE